MRIFRGEWDKKSRKTFNFSSQPLFASSNQITRIFGILCSARSIRLLEKRGEKRSKNRFTYYLFFLWVFVGNLYALPHKNKYPAHSFFTVWVSEGSLSLIVRGLKQVRGKIATRPSAEFHLLSLLAILVSTWVTSGRFLRSLCSIPSLKG